jgi:hypothetical protein
LRLSDAFYFVACSRYLTHGPRNPNIRLGLDRSICQHALIECDLILKLFW